MRTPTTDISGAVAAVAGSSGLRVDQVWEQVRRDELAVLWSLPATDVPGYQAIIVWARENGLDPRIIPAGQCWVVRLSDGQNVIAYNEIITDGPPSDDDRVPAPAARHPDWSPVTRPLTRPLLVDPPVI